MCRYDGLGLSAGGLGSAGWRKSDPWPYLLRIVTDGRTDIGTALPR